MEKNFRFWLPLEVLEKSGEGKNVKMKVGGIASTKKRDMDGESLDPNGFDLSYFTNKGIVNWNHNKSPDAIIGEPSTAKITDEGLYVEAELYPDNPLAKSVFKLAETLEKSSKTRRLGFSIEGKATERDENDNTSVKKALITNIALTISPKNPDSIVDIIKGNFTEISEEDLKPYNLDSFNAEFEEDKISKLIKGFESKNENDFEKGMEAGHESGTDLTNKENSGASLKEEDVEEDTKSQTEIPDNTSKSNKLNKSEALGILTKSSSVITPEKADLIFETIKKLEMTNENNVEMISEETLKKALNVLGLGESEGTDDLLKGADDDLNKGQDEDDSDAGKKKDKNTDNDDDDDDNKDIGDIKKSIDLFATENLESFKSVGVLLKGIYDQNQKLLDDNAELREQNTDLRKSFEEFAGQPAGQRKSVTSVRERDFNKGMDDENDFEKGVNILSISTNKPQVLNLLDKMAFEKGYNKEYADAMTTFESGNTIEKGIIDDIKEKYGITLVK